ncbi:endothelin-converting enzyme homolog isoform X1 [Varroa destructor]|uniref:Endothelin-converting enzyme 1 n=3 Tax=Varroa destructor TaxID=109461 RepID=A0A7M7KHF3_VARDE|nr:endothelin-converting enzyme homolog isoform X1 [Varroa destructor]XP_022666784.1 endothelin-converting enzyme homolog isoform X1 [Varroa destructor]XP_022666785.1 endothelin-converting enzyme homolog isoform X1 [Varroa destructor]XP_022666786.1 endothelin-converting enzyme homolog isoform X1 [Varroa destructor]XP_022666787.1 endothelin-converting enzyme homolog isoform X1 [Varroa destructor]XP_022666788.1 endothelin-converting enzyme homolog isoform X1 [Varroa destructor]XP_022666789.1 en
MNGIQLKPQAARYKRASFDEDEVSAGGGSVPSGVGSAVGVGGLGGGISPALDGSSTVLNVGHDPSRPSISLSGLHFRRRHGLCGHQCTTYECCLTILLMFSSAALLAVFLFGPNGFTRGTHMTISTHAVPGVCLAPECITVASAILSAMNHKVDPCDDFYEFACGGWVKQNPLPDGKSIWSTFGKLWQENQLVMKNILDDDTRPTNSVAERLAKTYYLSCLDQNSTIEALGSTPIDELLSQLGGWNISSSGFNVTSWKLQSAIELAQNTYSRSVFFAWMVAPDERNSSRHIITLDQGGLTLPSRDYYLNKTDREKTVTALKQYITQVGVLMGSNEEEAKTQAESIVNLELRMAEVTMPEDERRDEKALYNKMRIMDLQRLASFIDWVSFFRSGFSLVNISVTGRTEVVVLVPSYFRQLSVIIKDILAKPTGKITLANYIGWQTVNSLVGALAPSFREAQRVLQRALMGADGAEATWRQCISDTNNVLGLALSSMFVREVFDEQSKPVAEQMVREVKNAFKENLPYLNWMDDETRELAKDKADHVTDMIGFPSFISDRDKLDAKFEGLEMREAEYFDNNLRISQWMLLKNMRRLQRPSQRGEWDMSPIQVNAYYTPSKNQIVFPAGILQAPFYDKNYPSRSLNFGAMGVVMGHELTHAFDDQGREYDKEGNLKQWWNNRTIEAFQQRAKCFIDQYSSYKLNNDSINGKSTLGENMADNGGLKAAFHAYRGWLQSNTEFAPLPGVNLTHEQLFYVGFAQVWCSTETPEATHMQVLVDAHSPAKYRVIGTLSNSVEFSKTYKCKPTSPMNPPRKCEVW